MTLVELTRFIKWSRYLEYDTDRIVWANYSPGIWYTALGDDFDITDESIWLEGAAYLYVNYVSSVVIDYGEALSRKTSISGLADEPSFYWDGAEKHLYIRLPDFDPPSVYNISIGKTQGFSDTRAVYVDDLFYSPILESIPSVEQQQDLQNYDELAFITGDIVTQNAHGETDELLRDVVYGNDIYIIHAPDIEGDLTRDDLTYIAALYVENYSPGIRTSSFSVQDRRKAQNIEVPTEVFTVADFPDIDDDLVNEPIPLAYGPLREIPAISCSDGVDSGNVTYCAAITMTDFGTIYVENDDDVYEEVTPVSTDLTSGTFVLAEADARNDSDATRDCKCVDCEGISITYASDIFKDLWSRYLGISYSSSTYDTDEWESEEVALDPVGYYIDDTKEMFEVFKDIQNGSAVGFRVEFLPDGRRTIRVDDFDRAVSMNIDNLAIQNLYDLEPESDSELLGAKFKIDYAQSYVDSDSTRTLIDTSVQETVKEKYLQEPTYYPDDPSLVQTAALAQDRLDYLIERFSEVPVIVPLELLGPEFFQMRIYDIVNVELNPGVFDRDAGTITSPREFLGYKKCQVLSIDPQLKEKKNNVSVLILDDVQYSEKICSQSWPLMLGVLNQRPMGYTHCNVEAERDYTWQT